MPSEGREGASPRQRHRRAGSKRIPGNLRAAWEMDQSTSARKAVDAISHFWPERVLPVRKPAQRPPVGRCRTTPARARERGTYEGRTAYLRSGPRQRSFRILVVGEGHSFGRYQYFLNPGADRSKGFDRIAAETFPLISFRVAKTRLSSERRFIRSGP